MTTFTPSESETRASGEFFTLRVPAATPLSQVIELGTAAVIEREQRPMRAVLIDTAATVDRDTYLATFVAEPVRPRAGERRSPRQQAAPLWPLSRQEN